MEFKIEQKKFSLEKKYTVFIDGLEKYIATTKLFRLFSEIVFEDLEKHLLKYTIKRRWAWFKYSYDLTNDKHSIFEFRTLSIWRRHYQCIVGTDNYEIIGHKGRKYSIYKNNNMIAFWELNKFTWFEGDKYTVTANNDVDTELVSCFCIIIDNANSENKRQAMDWNIGWFGPEARPFDAKWIPR